MNSAHYVTIFRIDELLCDLGILAHTSNMQTAHSLFTNIVTVTTVTIRACVPLYRSNLIGDCWKNKQKWIWWAQLSTFWFEAFISNWKDGEKLFLVGTLPPRRIQMLVCHARNVQAWRTPECLQGVLQRVLRAVCQAVGWSWTLRQRSHGSTAGGVLIWPRGMRVHRRDM